MLPSAGILDNCMMRNVHVDGDGMMFCLVHHFTLSRITKHQLHSHEESHTTTSAHFNSQSSHLPAWMRCAVISTSWQPPRQTPQPSCLRTRVSRFTTAASSACDATRRRRRITRSMRFPCNIIRMLQNSNLKLADCELLQRMCDVLACFIHTFTFRANLILQSRCSVFKVSTQ